MKLNLILKGFLFATILLQVNYSFGQRVNLPDSSEVFGIRVQELLATTKNKEADSIGTFFSAAWSSGNFTSEQQKLIIDFSRKLLTDRIPINPTLRDYFAVLSFANEKAISSEQMTDLIGMLSSVYESGRGAIFKKAVANLKYFFAKDALFFSNYNRLYHHNAEIKFVSEPIEEETAYYEQLLEESEEVVEEPEEEENWEDSEDDGWGDDGWGDSDNDGWSDAEPETTFQAEKELNPMEEEESTPSIEGPHIKFTSTDLIFVTKWDSVVLEGGKGEFDFLTNTYTGSGGTFDWEIAGLEPESAYAKLGKYSFNTRLPTFRSDDATLFYDTYLNEPVGGSFLFKSTRHDSTGSKYPHFVSLKNDIVVNHPQFPGLKYKGGFSLYGKKMIGASLLGGEATISFADSTGRRFRSTAKKYVFKDSLIEGRNAKITIYHGRDSITHPSVKLRYYSDINNLKVIKEDNGYEYHPFSSNFFIMDINADIIEWPIGADSMNISILNARNLMPAIFESKTYYHPEKIEDFGNIYNFNPLLLTYNYGKKIRSRSFYDYDLIDAFDLNENAIRSSLKLLMFKGYIDYDLGSGLITLTDKTMHTMLARGSRIDYDDLVIPSLSPENKNATLDLTSNEMIIRGIKKFYISELLDVYILPENNSVTLQKGRDFSFNGQMFAGNFEFAGRDFTFKYDSFLVDMQNIDSIRFYIENEETKTKELASNKLVSNSESVNNLETSLKNTNGTLFINRPDNKSGREIHPEYPFFDANRGAVVYFDNNEVLDSAYSKSVYFIIPPFAVDSLSSSDPATIGFDGTFVSGGIMPDFRETLRIMPDRSLGFNHAVAPGGYNLYGTEAKFYNKLNLDNNGLVGNGKIDYLTTAGESTAFTFYEDSVTGIGSDLLVQNGTLNAASYPDVNVPFYKIKWLPYQDEMSISNLDVPFNIYDNSATVDGEIMISKNGVTGKGKLDSRGFHASSDNYTLTENEMTGRNADFTVDSKNPEKPLMVGKDIRFEFDILENVGQLSPEVAGVAALEFPFAEVRTSISQATWDRTAEKVYMVKPENVDIKYSYFYSTRPELDSLAFNATSGEYDLATSELLVKGIPYITIADALVIPENNEVLVLENSQIDELHNTKLVIDTLHGYHKLYDGNITINSRKSFSGNAIYQFLNSDKDTFALDFQTFELRQIETGSKFSRGLQTYSETTIDEGYGLEISPGFLYKGNVFFYAKRQALELDGYVKLSAGNSDNASWIKYQTSDEETQEVIIDFDNSLTENSEGLTAGIFYNTIHNELYMNFVEDLENTGDDAFFKPYGMLRFLTDQNAYIIQDTAKANGSSYKGSTFAYNESNGNLVFEGPFNFTESTKEVQVLSAGSGKGNRNDLDFKVNTFTIFKMDLIEQAYNIMAYDMFQLIETLGAPEAEPDLDRLMYKMAEFVGDRTAIEYDQRSLQEYVPINTVSSRLAGSIVFSNLNMAWNKDLKAWYSTGRLGLSHIGRNDINAMVDGFVEIRKTSTGDAINIFMQVSADSWFYFNFEENRLLVSSSNYDFNDLVLSKSKVDKAKFGEYVFVSGEKNDALNYVNRFRLDHLGITEPYVLNMPTPITPDGPEGEEDLFGIDAIPLDSIPADEELPADLGFGEEEELKAEEEEEDDDEGF